MLIKYTDCKPHWPLAAHQKSPEIIVELAVIMAVSDFNAVWSSQHSRLYRPLSISIVFKLSSLSSRPSFARFSFLDLRHVCTTHYVSSIGPSGYDVCILRQLASFMTVCSLTTQISGANSPLVSHKINAHRILNQLLCYGY